MRIQFDGQGRPLSTDLLSHIAERLETLNAPYEDIFEARVTLMPFRMQHKLHLAAQVELLLVGRTLCAMHEGATPHDAVNAALTDIVCQLNAFRILRPRVNGEVSASPSGADAFGVQQGGGARTDGYTQRHFG